MTDKHKPVAEQVRIAHAVAAYHEQHAAYGGAGREQHELFASAIRALLAERDALTRAGVGYSQQTVDAITKERDALRGGVSGIGDLKNLDAVLYDRPAGRNIIGHAVDTITALRQRVTELTTENERLGAHVVLMEAEVARYADASAGYVALRDALRHRMTELDARRALVQRHRAEDAGSNLHKQNELRQRAEQAEAALTACRNLSDQRVGMLVSKVEAVEANRDAARRELSAVMSAVVHGQPYETFDPVQLSEIVAGIIRDRDSARRENVELRLRLSNIASHCEDQTDGDCPSHDTLAWQVQRLAVGKSI